MSLKLLFKIKNRENQMKIRRQISASARRKHLKVQHHKMNNRRQFYFNQIVMEVNEPKKQ